MTRRRFESLTFDTVPANASTGTGGVTPEPASCPRSDHWVGGNRATLLENGETYFPRVFEVIAAARREVIIETFILFDDEVGQDLKRALLEAAAQGARIDLTIDGWGSAFLPADFTTPLTDAGIRLHVFDPVSTVFKWRPNIFRRLHRKLVVIDGERAFVGGINFSADHLAGFGPKSKQDYAVELEGPIVATIHAFAREALQTVQVQRGRLAHFHAKARHGSVAPADPPQAGYPKAGEAQAGEAQAGHVQAMLVTRDNFDHRSDIELHYRAAIRLARQRVTIANAYCFPGYLLLKELVAAARRGVTVRLIVQGEPDIPIAHSAPALLYSYLLRAGVEIHEYRERPFHGKVALVDDGWATIGSSNLDPLSLSFNLEANVMLHDRAFNRTLAERLDRLLSSGCRRVERTELPPSRPWHAARNAMVFHFLRHFPSWAGWLPTHRPRLQAAGTDGSPDHA